MKLTNTLFIALLGYFLFSSTCVNAANTGQAVSRWYSPQQAKNGQPLYQKYCASCHQADASGDKNWNYKDENGHYPAPPLNGAGHTFHHPLINLRNTIHKGGKPNGGTMPSFAGTLNKQQIDEVLAWIQSNWSDELYRAWIRWSKQAKKH